jgi:hypothetical protein
MIKYATYTLIFLWLALPAPAQSIPNMTGIPAEYMEQIRKMMPPGAKLPPEWQKPVNNGKSEAVEQQTDSFQVQEGSYTPLPSPPQGGGGGGTTAGQKAAVAAVTAELEKTTYSLPKKEDAPAKSTIMQLARTRHTSAQSNLSVDDLREYSRTITWVPRFDGKSQDPEKARTYSLPVSVFTNFYNRPQFVIASAVAVFSLDPQSSANANNFASALVTAGERLYPDPADLKFLSAYRKDAESVFLYSIALSMKGDAWTDASLTPIINLGNLYIDMDRLEEARSLFMVARKLSPFSWDAALGLSAYFLAINQPEKAKAVLDDEKLDRPMMYSLAKKQAKVLEKSDPFAELPSESPEKSYEEGIQAINSEPIATAADFIAQLDQDERNKMRYFIEHLPPKGSFTAPSITTVSQYASLKAISSPQGSSVLKDFREMIQTYALGSAAAAGKEQLKMLSRLGMNVDMGVDLDDAAKNPGKYVDSKRKNKVRVDKKKLMASIPEMRKQAEEARRDLATGKTASTAALGAQIDPFIAITQIEPQNYADPTNVLIQRHNFAVHNRKANLYNGYLYSVNKRTQRQVMETVKRYTEKVATIEKLQAEEQAEFERQREYAAQHGDSSVEWAIKQHVIHTKYFNQLNNAAEIGFGSAANIASLTYVQKIKPMAEAYYYDQIRHVALISDPEVRDQKEAELRRSINSALVWSLGTVATAHSSFHYHDDWDCDCNLAALLQQREEEQAARHDAETARIKHNKAARAIFKSGEIPESSPLFKRLDSYFTEFNLGFITVRVSCARTTAKLNVKLPVAGSPEIFGSITRSEFTGAATYGGGMKVSVGLDQKAGNVGAYLSLGGSVSTDGQGVVKDYSVTTGTGLTVSAKGTTVSVGGSLTFGKAAGQEWEQRDSDFAAGVSQSFKNGYGMSGNAAIEASSKRGCTLSGKVVDSIMPADADGQNVSKSPWEKVQGQYTEKNTKGEEETKTIQGHFGESFREKPVTDEFHKKKLWGGSFTF